MSNQTKKRNASDWRELVEAQERSNLTIRAFCGERDVNRNTFIYHRQKYRSGGVELGKRNGFITIQPTRPMATGQIYVRRGDLELELPADYPVAGLLELMSALPC